MSTDVCLGTKREGLLMFHMFAIFESFLWQMDSIYVIYNGHVKTIVDFFETNKQTKTETNKQQTKQNMSHRVS